MADYRDPKVTTPRRRQGGAASWIGIAVVVVLALLLLAWLFGWFGGVEVAPTGDAPVVTEETETPPPPPAN